MATYPDEHWKTLGQHVSRLRRARGFSTADWAAAVGRSTRVVLGLERGEPAGDATLRNVAEALGEPLETLYEVLASGTVGGGVQGGESFVASPGDLITDGRSTDADVLRAITAMSAAVDQLVASDRARTERERTSDQRDELVAERLAALEAGQRELSERMAKFEEPGS